MEWMIMPLKRYADFSGRSRRMEYWMWVVFNILVGVGFVFLSLLAGGGAALSGDPTAIIAASGAMGIVSILNLIVSLAFLIPSIAVSVRRLHDTNRSGWWFGGFFLFYIGWIVLAVGMFIALGAQMGSGSNVGTIGSTIAVFGIGGLVFFVYAIALLVFFCLEGTRGPNRFGPDPKDPGGDLESVFS
jgi:uncharacterized membrane protein YhaH (DUF805 family)